MKLTIIGGSGLIGSKLVRLLTAAGHEAVAASPSTGVDTLTGKGLAEALKGAQVVVDVSNSPSFADQPVLDFFTQSTKNIAHAAREAGVSHYVALSVTGTDRMQAAGYFRAKLAQETLIKESRIPYSIVRATQFFEFVKAIADSAVTGDVLRVPPVLFQPIAAEDVAAAVERVAVAAPLNETIEIAGPETFRFDALIRLSLRARGDHREVIGDPAAGYFGTKLEERSLVPLVDQPQTAKLRFEDWAQR